MDAVRVTHLWRHPIKAVGVEPIDAVRLIAGKTLPGDRIWAIAHEAAKLSPGGDGWQACTNFCRGAKFPGLMAVRLRTDPHTGRMSLTHPERPALDISPDAAEDATRLIDWIRPLTDPGRAQPSSLYRAPDRGLTDSDFPSISLLSRASLDALSARLGQPLAMERFRGNVWVEGLAPFAEFDLVGHEIRIGTARLHVRERITRCKATMANPATGRIDADTLKALQDGWGHRDFGVALEVTADGTVACGDRLAS